MPSFHHVIHIVVLNQCVQFIEVDPVHLPSKAKPTTLVGLCFLLNSRSLLCPRPGLLFRVANVVPGDVQE